MNKLVVVGDKFSEFAKLNGTITLTQLSMMAQIPAKVFTKKNHLVPGLGCKTDEVSQFALNVDNSEHLDLTSLISFYQSDLIPNKYTHQNNIHNVLIGKARQLDDTKFELPFILDERNMLMGDHQTGSHVQGMIIVEAFRQTFIAITEEFYLDNKNIQETYFVINEMNIKFENFVFPLPAQIYFELISIDQNEYRTKLQAKITINQANKVCATMSTSFSVYPSKDLSKKEKKLASEVLTSYLTNYLDNVA